MHSRVPSNVPRALSGLTVTGALVVQKAQASSVSGRHSKCSTQQVAGRPHPQLQDGLGM